MKRKSILHIAQVLCLCMAMIFSLSISEAKAEQSIIEKVLDRGVLRVGFSTFVPWAMQDAKGEYVGFEVDIARRLAKDLGVELQLVPTSWDGIIPALMMGKFDVIIGGMTATTKRSLSVNFTIPYDYVTMGLAFNKKLSQDITSMEDLNKKEVLIATRAGSSAYAYAKANFPNANIRAFNDEALAVQEVLSDRATLFIGASPLPSHIVTENQDVLVSKFSIDNYKEPISFAVRKGDVDTLNVFDTWIRQVEGLDWIQERREYWFVGTEWKSLL